MPNIQPHQVREGEPGDRGRRGKLWGRETRSDWQLKDEQDSFNHGVGRWAPEAGKGMGDKGGGGDTPWKGKRPH